MDDDDLQPFKLDPFDMRIVRTIENNPGIDSVELGQKLLITKYTLLKRSEKLERGGYIERRGDKGKLYRYYIKPDFDIPVTDEVGDRDDDEIGESLSRVHPKPLETLITIAKNDEMSVQQLMEADGYRVTAQTIDYRLRTLVDLKLITRYFRKGKYIYELKDERTRKIIQLKLAKYFF